PASRNPAILLRSPRARSGRTGPANIRLRPTILSPYGPDRSRNPYRCRRNGRPDPPHNPHPRGCAAHGAHIICRVRCGPVARARSIMSIEKILDDFDVLDSWDDRYRYVIELGRALPPFPEPERTDKNKVQGCASQVWLVSETHPAKNGAGPVVEFQGD